MSRSVVRLAYALLAAMTLLSFGGPFLIGAIMRGGVSPDWPPDRPVEWIAFTGVTGLVVAVLIGMALIWVVNMKSLRAAKERARLSRESKAEADRGAP
jgi:hypothetical protein